MPKHNKAKPEDLTEKLVYGRRRYQPPKLYSDERNAPENDRSDTPYKPTKNTQPKMRPLAFDPFSFAVWSATAMLMTFQLFVPFLFGWID